MDGEESNPLALVGPLVIGVLLLVMIILLLLGFILAIVLA